MPLYDFKCEACGLVVERLMHHREVNRSLVLCPEGHGVMMRIYTAPSVVQIKGFSAVNGYARTDTGWVRQGEGIRTRVSDTSDK